MRKVFQSTLVALVAIATTVAPVTAYAGCQATCDMAKADKPPSDFGSSACQKNPECNSCLAGKFQGVAQSQIRPQCETVDLVKKAIPMQWTATVIYTAAATFCWIACAGGDTPYVAEATAICKYGGIGTALWDMLGAKSVTQLSTQMEDFYSKAASYSSMGSGLIAGANLLAGSGSSSASNASNGGKSSSSNTMSCVSAGFFTAMAAFKGMSAGKSMPDTKKKACDNVEKYESDMKGEVNSCYALLPGPPKPELASKADDISGQNSSPSGGIEGLAGEDELPLAAYTPGEGVHASATAGDNALKEMGNPFTNAANKGLKPSDIVKKLAAGESTDAIISSLSGVNPSLVSEGKKLGETIAQNAKFGSGATGSMYAGGGAAPSKGQANANPYAGLFGMGGSPAGGPAEAKFGVRKPASSLAGDGDIFHASFPGSIFQIVSIRTRESIDRVHALPPVSPLNKALSVGGKRN